MKFPPWMRIYGDVAYRGTCPTETAEQVTTFARIRRHWPDTLGVVALHVRNEGKRTAGQVWHQKAEGLTRGAPDIIIPGSTTLIIELKRRDHTASKWQHGQLEYLQTAHELGSWVCVALGADAAIEAINCYLSTTILTIPNG